MHRRPFLLTGLAAAAAPHLPRPALAREAATRNVIFLTDVSGSGARSYPVRIGRPFMRGEIAGIPQASIDGRALQTQADVKTRWPDGSVQHAILSFIVAAIPARGTVTVAFGNQPPSASAGPTSAQMLDRAFNFDASIAISQDKQTHAASARDMLEHGNFTAWCQGPVATTLVLADHSTARRYDLGFDELRPIRPIFHATFWPELKRVHVRAIAENVNTETMQNLAYALAIRAGQTPAREVFRQDRVPHYAATRWSRSFWIGASPSAVQIDHNLAYLTRTLAFPNFDTSLHVPDAVAAQAFDQWQKTPRQLYDAGGWTKYMPTTGGRNDIGPYPELITAWLFTGDHRLFAIVSEMSELAGAWPMHVREGNPQKKFDAAGTVPALGLPLSVYARPTLWLFDGRDKSGPENRVDVHGPSRIVEKGEAGGGWVPDVAHMPDPFSALYTLTGEPWYLEQTQFWAAWQALQYDPGYKGPPPSGVMSDQVRGDAWGFRNRVHAAYLSPDKAPEKPYFTALIHDAIAYWEGRHGVHGTSFEGSKFWVFGQTKLFDSPLHFWNEDGDMRPNGGVNIALLGSYIALWQHYMLIFELGRAAEKGFPTDKLLSYVGGLLIGQFRDPSAYSPYNLQRYETGVRAKNWQFFKTWPDTLPAYQDPKPPMPMNPDVRDGYSTYAYGASTMLTREPGGPRVYEFLRRTVFDTYRNSFAAAPKWAFLPRA